MDELISVLVPVFNMAHYLERSIGSILNQTYSNLEIIAVDDGSQDDSLAVLKKLAGQDSRIRIIHQDNGGVTSARLMGIVAAKGEWIGFVDGDDEIEPYMYERLISNAHKYCANISHCGYQMIFPSRTDYYYNTGRVVLQDHLSGMKDLIEGVFVEPGLWNKLFYKKLFFNLLNQEIDLSIRNNEDLLMNFFLFQQAEKSVFEDICPYHYIVHKNSAATSEINENKLRDPLLVLKKIKKEVKDNPVLLNATNSRIVGALIRIACIPLEKQSHTIKTCRKQSRKELRNMLPEILFGDYSLKMKVLSTWIAFLPWTYSIVHAIYGKISGTDKKYQVS